MGADYSVSLRPSGEPEGWLLCLLQGCREVGGGVFPPGIEGYCDAYCEGEEFSRGGLVSPDMISLSSSLVPLHPSERFHVVFFDRFSLHDLARFDLRSRDLASSYDELMFLRRELFPDASFRVEVW